MHKKKYKTYPKSMSKLLLYIILGVVTLLIILIVALLLLKPNKQSMGNRDIPQSPYSAFAA